MWDLVDLLSRLLAPILPHSADEAFKCLHKSQADDESCVHLTQFLDFKVPILLDEAWPSVLEVRDQALKALEEAKARGIDNPLDAEVVLVDSDGRLKRFVTDLADMLGVSRVNFVETGEITVNDLRQEAKCDRCWQAVIDVKQRGDSTALCDRCAEAIG